MGWRVGVQTVSTVCGERGPFLRRFTRSNYQVPARSLSRNYALNREIVLSGMQCSGVPTLGNYLGAISQWTKMQYRSGTDVFFSAVDLHTITVPRQPNVLRQDVFDTVIAYLACGVDPEHSVVFLQSHVKEHTELAWLLSCFTSFGDLTRMTQWKSKSQNEKISSLGLFSYPVLMAADILLYKATLVPVGEDQIQHLELARDIARAFNRHYKTQVLVEPHYSLGNAPRIMSLRDPSKKMSKSDRSSLSRITLTDSPEEISKKIQKAVTDSVGSVFFDKELRPGISNLMVIYGAITGKTIDCVEQEFVGSSTDHFKRAVSEALIEHLNPIQNRMQDLRSAPEFVSSILDHGAQKAAARARETLISVKTCIGLL